MLSFSSALAQVGWEDDPFAGSVESVFDQCDVALRTPFLEPGTSAVEVEPLVVFCDFEPEVFQVFSVVDVA